MELDERMEAVAKNTNNRNLSLYAKKVTVLLSSLTKAREEVKNERLRGDRFEFDYKTQLKLNVALAEEDYNLAEEEINEAREEIEKLQKYKQQVEEMVDLMMVSKLYESNVKYVEARKAMSKTIIGVASS